LNTVPADRALRRAALLLALAGSQSTIAADESSIRLADGPGLEQVQAGCSMCHSLDYIVMNSPFQDRAAWEKTVNKMIKVYGAPLSDEDAAAIVSYLDRSYGK
jgi:cytochrome c5